jgi:hypothetical protein
MVDSPLRTDEIGSIGRKNRDNGNIRFIGRLFQRGKLAGQLHGDKKYRREIEELDKIMENLNLGEQLEDFMICCGSISKKSTDTWKTGLELHEDNQTTLSRCGSKFNNQYQILAIIGDNSEQFDNNNNPVLNPTNVTRGANHLAEGDTANSLTNREKFGYQLTSGTQSKQQMSTT